MALRKGLFVAVLARKSLANEGIFVTERRPSGLSNISTQIPCAGNNSAIFR
jgi:hypothetical protein